MRKAEARTKLLDVALQLVRAKGYAATSVDDLCRAAGVTKGAFFHHFESKEALAVAAVARWAELTEMYFADAPFHDPKDPLERVLAYVTFRRSLLRGSPAEFTCFAGTAVQETYGTSEPIRAACEACIWGHAQTLVADLDAALQMYPVTADVTAQSLALFTQAVLQGAFVLAKAQGSAAAAIESVDHLYRYLELLFRPSRQPQPHETPDVRPTPSDPQSAA